MMMDLIVPIFVILLGLTWISIDTKEWWIPPVFMGVLILVAGSFTMGMGLELIVASIFLPLFVWGLPALVILGMKNGIGGRWGDNIDGR